MPSSCTVEVYSKVAKAVCVAFLARARTVFGNEGSKDAAGGNQDRPGERVAGKKGKWIG